MKKILLSIVCFLAYIFSIQAQILFGTTSGGGKEGGGTINKFIPGKNNLTIVKTFESLASRPYYTNFIQASNGKLYGMTSGGGSNDAGVIFSFDPTSGKYTKLKDFDTEGTTPNGSLMQASDGKLYGMSMGGINNTGIIFSFDPSSGKYTQLKVFDYTDGGVPNGSLMQASDGKLYGMTYGGGSNEEGVIFSFDPSSSTYLKLLDFDGTNGSEPLGSFVQASNGKLYGMTINGGKSRMGNIFSFDPSSSTYAKVKDFDSTTGSYPYGNLTLASNGKLYGVTANGGTHGNGVIFSLDPSSSKYIALKNIGGADGTPYGSLAQAGNGKLYGMTAYGGSKDGGIIFSFDPSSSTYTKLKNFDAVNGDNPYGSLMQASNGRLYGLTTYGGSEDAGVIFSFDPSSSTYTKLRDIASNDNGSNVSGGLIRAANKKLYGVTSAGGINNMGVIFSYDPSSSKYAKLRDFDSANGARPYDGLLQANDGKLYGMTDEGGRYNVGVIFSYDPSTATYTKLKDFDSANGAFPYGRLIQAKDGKLYGATSQGGSRDAGVIFSLDLSTSAYKKLKDLGGTDGNNPEGSLMQASNGKLYGMTSEGGKNGDGVIFSYDPSTSTYTKLRDFNYIDGDFPYGSLIQAGDGRLYGLTSKGGVGDGGDYTYGVIFSFDPSSSKYKKLREFDYENGFGPIGSLMQASNGKLYGATNYGGLGGPDEDGNGTIFSFDPFSSAYTKLQDFVGVNGIYSNSPFIQVNDCIAGTTYYRDADRDGYGDPFNSVAGCPVPAGYVDNNRDCNDSNSAIHPHAPEVCNGIDDDCDGQTDSTTIEAEDEVLNVTTIAFDHPGFTGSGFVVYDAPGEFIEFTVNAAVAGSYSLLFRYANGGATDRPLQLKINGVLVSASLSFPVTGGWATWSVSSVAANLIAGANKIRLTTLRNNSPHIDHLTVPLIGCQPGYLEAEQAVLKGAVIANSSPGFTGSGYADYQHASGDYIEWTVNDSLAGSYTLKFRYANGGTANRPLQLSVNGVVVSASLSFSPTGGWATWSASSATGNLIAGTNKIRLTTIGSNGPNVDHLSLEVISSGKRPTVSVMGHLPGSPAILRAEVAPNPVESGNAKLIVSTSSNLPIELQLFDIAGRSYPSLKFAPRGSTTFNFPVNDLSPGAYTITLKQGALITHARLIVGGK